MAILRKHKREHYTIIENTVFMDYELSYKAKGLLCQMLSLPDGWSFSIEGLARLSSDGKASVASALDELKAAGYFSRRQVRNGNRISGVEYVISETKLHDFQELENQELENQDAGNQPQLNTNKSSTNKSTTKGYRFKPPAREEVQSYIDEKGYSIDAERFIDYYTANGWKVGKNPMKDWKATIRNWERRNGNDLGAGGGVRRRVRSGNGRSKGDDEQVQTGFIPHA